MTFRFAGFSVDPVRRELRLDGETVHVEPQVFDLLIYLLENRDRVVTKDELLAAVWGGRIVSDATLSSRINAARRAIGDSGEKQAFIRTVQRRGFLFCGDQVLTDASQQHPGGPALEPAAGLTEKERPRETATPWQAGSLTPPLDRPSIAVLPFTNMGADPYFADGVVEDIITALSRVPRLLVIARGSSFTYRDRNIDARQVGHELGVRYILGGSVRRAGGRLRITGQLVEAATGGHLWANNFDGDARDVFDLQDQVTASVVGAISPRLLVAEMTRVKIKRPENLDAYDLFLRALAALREMTHDRNEEALRLLERALSLDPDYAIAAGLGAWAYTLRFAQNWRIDAGPEKERGVELARQALANGVDDSEALAMGGYAVAFLGGELVEGLQSIESAIALNPNSAFALAHAGWVKCYLGQTREAVRDFDRAIRLSPRDITLFRMQAGLAFAHLLHEEFEAAVMWGRRALDANPNYTPTYRALACALAHLGRIDEAKGIARRLVQVAPDFNAGLEQTLFSRSGKLPLILSGLRLAELSA